MYHQRRRHGYRSGFTFLEVLVVVAILAGLATMVVPMFISRQQEAQKDQTRIEIKEIAKALEMYRLDNARYPTTEQGLKALMEKPTTDPMPNHWKQIMPEMPKDAWGKDFIYTSPGTHGPFDIVSLGPDGVQSDDDIQSWNLSGNASPTPQ